MEFNEILKQLLEDKGLKQADLCRLAQIQTSLMSEYVSGKKSPTLKNAIQIADALQISLDKLAGRQEYVHYEEALISPYRNELNACMDGLTEKEYTFLLDVLKALKQHLL